MLKTEWTIAGMLMITIAAGAQVDYEEDHPWSQKVKEGADAEVPGWFYNLGITGLRARLIPEEPKALVVKHVFASSPATGRVRVDDLIIGAGGKLFQNAHKDGYGEDKFGADGPIGEFAAALEESQSEQGGGRLSLTLRRGGQTKEVVLEVGRKYGVYSPTYPAQCQKSEKLLKGLLEYLVENQKKDGSFGNPVHNTFAPLALLAGGQGKHLAAVKRNVLFHAKETRPDDKRRGDLINWTYMSAAIVMSEYFLETGDKTLLPELKEIHDHLKSAQYLNMSQINPKARESHPDSFPKGPKDSHGGWGHNPGFEGYGPIAMLTGQGALAYALLNLCGLPTDREQHDAAYDFLRRGSGANGYVWYGDQLGGKPEGWADMGRTGAAALAYHLSPFQDPMYRERALLHSRVIGKHPQSFPDTHGSPPMGMAWAAAAAHFDPESFRLLMDANRWWFTLAQNIDGTFYYQPNRDNAGYGADARMTASSVVAFIFTLPRKSLLISGREPRKNTR